MTTDDSEELGNMEWVDEPMLASVGDEDVDYISSSQIKKYWNCPKKYWYRYHTDKEPTKADKGYKSLGIAVHEAIEEVLLNEVPMRESTLSRKLKRAYRNHDMAKMLKEGDESKYEDGLDFLEVAARYLDKTKPNVIAVEEDITYGLARDDIDNYIRAIMDVSTENKILDWKTGRIRDDTPEEEKIQAGAYIKAYQERFGHAPEEVQFVYLKEEKVRTLDADDELWDAMLKQARSLLRGKERHDFPAQPDDGCYFCGYELYCDASPAGVGNIDYFNY